MNKQKIDKAIDNAAEEVKQTIGLFSGAIDRATRCTDATTEKVGNRVREGALHAADKIEETATAAADRIREKARR